MNVVGACRGDEGARWSVGVVGNVCCVVVKMERGKKARRRLPLVSVLSGVEEGRK